jgi:hypothetical protein
MSNGRGMPTSRAYWELRAEQMLNGLFSPQPAIDVEICDLPGGAPPPAAASPPAPGARAPAPDLRPQGWRGPGPWPVAVAALAVFAATALALAFGQWQHQQRALREERDLLLLERLRSLGPASAPAAPVPLAPVPPAPDLGPAPAAPPPADQPPPPAPDWIQQLPTLPAPNPPPRPAAATARPALSAPPQLVGVVQIPGRPAAAIFQQGEGSTTVAVGERIGTSGWRLRAADAEGAVIEQAGQMRRISLSNGFGGGG